MAALVSPEQMLRCDSQCQHNSQSYCQHSGGQRETKEGHVMQNSNDLLSRFKLDSHRSHGWALQSSLAYLSIGWRTAATPASLATLFSCIPSLLSVLTLHPAVVFAHYCYPLLLLPYCSLCFFLYALFCAGTTIRLEKTQRGAPPPLRCHPSQYLQLAAIGTSTGASEHGSEASTPFLRPLASSLRDSSSSPPNWRYQLHTVRSHLQTPL